MEYISNNFEISNIIKKFYLQEASPIEVADIYFKYNLYSAAATYYNIHLQTIRNLDQSIDNYNFIKSYCFSQMASCYYYQELDHNYSGWQLEMIHDLCQEAIIYDADNIKAYYILGQIYLILQRNKEAYFAFKKIIMHLSDDNKYLSDQLYSEIYESILLIFELCKSNQIIITNNIFWKIYNFLINSHHYTFENIEQVTLTIKEHLNKDEIEYIIMNGTF